MQDDLAGEIRQHARCFVVGVPAVDHHGLPELGGELELGREDAALLVVRRVVPEEVEPDLADGNGVGRDDRAWILPVRRLVGMDAGRDVDARFALGDLARRACGGEARTDRDHPPHARGAGSLQRTRGVLERIEVGVRVDHTGSSFLNSGAGSRSVCPAGRSVGPQPRRQSP